MALKFLSSLLTWTTKHIAFLALYLVISYQGTLIKTSHFSFSGGGFHKYRVVGVLSGHPETLAVAA
jgi:hypothetical protein